MIGCITVVFLGIASQFDYGSKSHQKVTYHLQETSPDQKWLLK